MSERPTVRTPSRTAIRRIALARAISFTGGSAAFMALNFEVYRITGSAGWLAATLLLTFGVVGLAGPIAGILSDRFDRKRVMVTSDLAAAAVFGAMGFAHRPAPLVALAFVSALVETPFRAASGAAIPNLIRDESQLGWANGLVSLGANAGILLGPVVGGVLLAVFHGAQGVFLANAVSFVLSAALVATVRGRFREHADGAVGSIGAPAHRGAAVGFRFLLGDRILRTVSYAWVAVVAGGAVCMVADVPLATLFGAGSWGYGLMIAGWGAGSILGSLAGRWVNERREPLVLIAGATACALGTAAVAVSPVFWPVVAAILVAGVGDASMMVAGQSIIQRRTPDALRGRVMAAQDAMVQMAMALSFCAAGLVVAFVRPRGAYLIGGVTALLAVVLLLPMRRSAPSDRFPERVRVPLGQPPPASSERDVNP
jgi:MFS family permease